MEKTKSKKAKIKTKKSMPSLLSIASFEGFIKTLKINPEQERFLFDELPKMDWKERMELLEMLTKVYALNQEEVEAIKRLEDSWE